MPSLVMLPFIQCHQTRGRALPGGFSKPLFSGSGLLCAQPMLARRRSATPNEIGFFGFITICFPWLQLLSRYFTVPDLWPMQSLVGSGYHRFPMPISPRIRVGFGVLAIGPICAGRRRLSLHSFFAKKRPETKPKPFKTMEMFTMASGLPIFAYLTHNKGQNRIGFGYGSPQLACHLWARIGLLRPFCTGHSTGCYACLPGYAGTCPCWH